MFGLHVCVYHVCSWCPRRPLDHLELELQVVVSCHVGAGIEPRSCGRTVACFVLFFVFNFVLVLCEFYIMHSNITHLPFPGTHSPFWIPPTEKKILLCHSVSHSIALCPHIFACKCSLPWVIGLVLGRWLLLHHQYWILTGTPLRYPVVALCLKDPVVLDL
jgi:hypothetical protein